jgi:S1-C subfamily serine protease
VEDGSIASQAGVQAGDVLVEVAGRSCRTVEDVVDRIVLQPPGSWLPLKVSRGTDVMDLIAKFPAQR